MSTKLREFHTRARARARGVTWLPEPWLGVRVMGGANASFSVTVEGMPEQVLWGLGVFAEAGVVVRI